MVERPGTDSTVAGQPATKQEQQKWSGRTATPPRRPGHTNSLDTHGLRNKQDEAEAGLGEKVSRKDKWNFYPEQQQLDDDYVYWDSFSNHLDRPQQAGKVRS